MSISPINNASSVYATQAAQSTTPPKPAQSQSTAVQDTVHLSKAAQAAIQGGADADHDGDGH